LRKYTSKCHRRIGRHLGSGGGKYILGVASGPTQHPEHLEYSKDFNFRVCAGISPHAICHVPEDGQEKAFREIDKSLKPGVWGGGNTNFAMAYIHELLLGRLVLSLIYRPEAMFPRHAGRLGQYTPGVLRKTPGGDAAAA
jgi:hypothetical protein